MTNLFPGVRVRAILNVNKHVVFGLLSLMYRRVSTRKRRRPRRYRRRAYGNVSGKGDYWEDFGRNILVAGGTALGGIGGAFGGPAGSLIGGAAGGAAGSALSDIVGFGDYAINQNSLMNLDMGTEVPSVHGGSNKFCISHREYIGDVITPSSATNFNLVSYRINAGQSGTFPWLSNIASNFEQYYFTGMIFEFKSLSSEYATGAALGAIVMSTDYDSADANFANKQEMENTQYATSGKPSVNIVHPIECAHGLNNMNSFFVNTTSVPSGKDIRFYDLGNFQIATQGLSATAGTVLGELWVSYEVCMYKPILSPSSTANAHFELPTTVSASHYLGADTSTITQAVSTTAVFGSCSNSTFTFNTGAPLGYYTLCYYVKGVSTTLTTKMGVTRGDSTSIGLGNFFHSDAADFEAEVAGAVGDIAWFVSCIQLKAAINTSGNNSYLTITAGTLPTGITNAEFVVNYWGSQPPF